MVESWKPVLRTISRYIWAVLSIGFFIAYRHRFFHRLKASVFRHRQASVFGIGYRLRLASVFIIGVP